MLRVFRVLAMAALFVVWPSSVTSQESKPPKKKPPTDGAPIEVRFADSSVVRMTFAQPSLEVVTKFGKLQVPIDEIRGIEFGIRYPEGLENKITQLIEQLSSSSVREVNEAREDLLSLKALSYPAVKRASTSTNPKIASHAYDIVKKLEEIVPVPARLRDHDLIRAAEFPIAGRIAVPSFKGRTKYFGEVTVQIAEIRNLRSLASGGDVELTIEAAKYAALSQTEWLETDVDVDEGTPLVIEASGTVDLYPSGGNYKTNPDGNPPQGRSPDGNPPGALLGRIGTNGKTFVVGGNYKGSASESGKLYLRISCSPWNNASTGSYQVKIFPNANDK
jgi:hypothetical protein